MIRPQLSLRLWYLPVIAILGAVAWLGLHGVAASAPPAANADPGGPRIVAAGTAKFQMGAQQDNATFTHVKLAADIAAKLGDDYIVMVSSRFPSGGYPFFTPLWKPAKDGFDATMIDVTLGPNSTESFAFNPNKTFLIDWIVVKK